MTTYNSSQNGSIEKTAYGLGWFSIGLGLAEVLAPNGLADFIGVRRHPVLFRFLGAREIAAGVGILTKRKPEGWMWSRVIGDIMDLSLLGAALGSDRTERDRAGAATAAVIGVTALDIYTAQELSRQTSTRQERDIHVVRSVTVDKEPDECYRYWRDFENLSRFMSHLESVRVSGGGRSHWIARAPGGRTVEWDAEIVNDQPGSRIGWQSVEPADVENHGSVSFDRAPGGRGTVVRVDMHFTAPGGALAAKIAKMFGAVPAEQIAGDLRRFKQILETGAVVKSDASIHRGMHAAQPSSERGEREVRQPQTARRELSTV